MDYSDTRTLYTDTVIRPPKPRMEIPVSILDLVIDQLRKEEEQRRDDEQFQRLPLYPPMPPQPMYRQPESRDERGEKSERGVAIFQL